MIFFQVKQIKMEVLQRDSKDYEKAFQVPDTSKSLI